MNCPKCGKPMRIYRTERGGKRCRVWRCPSWNSWESVSDSCLTIVEIPDDERLTIAVIAEDMARYIFTDSSHQAKKQAGYRRIAGSLRKLSEGREYLSDSELSTLHDASEILERLGSAAEKAKKELKRLEAEEDRRVSQRRKEAHQVLTKLFDTDNLLDFTIETLALKSYAGHGYGYIWENGWINNIRKRLPAGQALNNEIRRFVKYEFDSSLSGIVGDISRQHAPVGDLIKAARVKINEEREKIKVSQHLILDELREHLAVESSKNVVILSKK